ncbi:MAG: electron transfer flavoprotein subunit alpha/FixB family protein [Saprospiraceae bacterium]|nr:electron transfer flavoprotein subunit alpha/FixB family protein [Saprospiraceae bacterium]
MILVYAESNEGALGKSAFEVVTFGHKVAQLLGKQCIALVLGNAADAGILGSYGAQRVMQLSDASLDTFDGRVHAQVIHEVAEQLGADVVIMPHGPKGHATAGRVAVRLNAGCLTGINAIPTLEGEHLVAEKDVFSGKAIHRVAVTGEKKVLTIMGNTVKPERSGTAVDVESVGVTPIASTLEVIDRQKQTSDRAPLPEAELVVSAGRGMKGPENWGIIEELADALGATTACSRPVADTGWRPHHEHVGQTGVAIRPNLYIAAGISGAIQHLAGVSASKCIVVINKDPEAPFFKAADYGVCADLFEVVPKLTAALQNRS